MATQTKAQIQAEIIAGILTGGNRTKAVDVRSILNNTLDSYPNVKDGGYVFETQVGYNSLITLTDNKSFVYKKYVDDLVSAGGITGNGGPNYILKVLSITGGPTGPILTVQNSGIYEDDSTRTMSNSMGNVTVDYENAILYEKSGIISADINNHTLWDSTGLVKAIEYGNSGVRKLYKSNGDYVLDFENEKLFKVGASGGIYTRDAIFGSAFAVIRWDLTNNEFYDGNGTDITIRMNDRALFKSSFGESLNWEQKILWSDQGYGYLWGQGTFVDSTQLKNVGVDELMILGSAQQGVSPAFLFTNGSGVASWTSGYTYFDSRYLQLSGGTMTGNLLFSGGFGIDTTSTVGTDTLNIGTTNANVINYGNSSTIHNFLGTAIYELQVNSYVTDKLMTLNYGGTTSSGIGVGFEIEENSTITGYFKTNAARSGFSIKAPANTSYTDFVLTASTPRTKTFQDTSSTIAEYGNKLSVFASTTSAELAGVISDETGTGPLVFATSPTFTTPLLGTPTSGTLTNCTGLPLSSGVSGLLPGANGGTGVANTGITMTFAANFITTGTLTPTLAFPTGGSATYTFPSATSTLLANNLGISGGSTYIGGTAVGDKHIFRATSFASNTASNILWQFIANSTATIPVLAFGDGGGTGDNYFYTQQTSPSTSTNFWLRGGATYSYFNASSDLRFLVGGTAYVVCSGSSVSVRQALTMFTAMTLTFCAGTTTVAPYSFQSGTLKTTATKFAMEVSSEGQLFYSPAASQRNFIAMWGYVAKTANYTATVTDYTIDCTANSFTVTLPTAGASVTGVPNGRVYRIKNSGTGTITIATTSSQTIDGSTTKTLSVQYSGIIVQSNGSNWITIGTF